MVVIRKVYDYVESVLWASLAVFVSYFLIFVVPKLPEIRSRAESIRMLRVSAENSSYCEKWGMKPGSHDHTLCKMDLQELRDKIEQELADQGKIL